MPDDVVKYAKAGAVATITLNRPDKHNALRHRHGARHR